MERRNAMTFSHLIEMEDGELLDLEIEYDCEEGDDGDWDNPPEPGGATILSAIDPEGKDRLPELGECTVRWLEELAMEDAAEQYQSRLADKFELSHED
jgi:hypothetical protein